MAINIHRESAKIIEFPIRPRRRMEGGLTVPAGRYEVAVSVVESCWYHDEAVHDEVASEERPKPC
ncbi:DUF2735 domain-containing protein [Neorhizobium alkalisoli]|uniref:Uncharacterized protein DUF2735 n=1 Tax=Neorhizobium alkalisoli TaxID=528178 RepID=A0A561QWT1_9HYPH|nr:DUF2735 domain-containing protein [Neorhizobium alkalisoli]TWF54837.1 uncharacterized protein DUF2735 [Neorhizobium alkalisoli]